MSISGLRDAPPVSMSACVRMIGRAVNAETDSIVSWLRGELDKACRQQPDNAQDAALVDERINTLSTAIAANAKTSLDTKEQSHERH